MKWKLKSALCLAMALLLSLSLAACGGAQQGESATDTGTAAKTTAVAETTAAPKEPVTLSLLMFTDWWNQGGWEDVVNDVESKAPQLGFRLEVEKIAGGDTGSQIVRARYAAGEMPDLHAFFAADGLDRECGGIANFIDIKGDWVNNYEPDLISSKVCSMNGTVYGIPFGSVSYDGFYYNKRVFSELDIKIPNNWDELLAVCDKLKAAGKTPVFYAGKDAWTLQLMPIDGFSREDKARSLNDIVGEININKGKFANQKLFIDTLAKMKELKDKGYVNETFLSDGYDTAQKAIAEGTAGMFAMASWVSGEFTKQYPDKDAEIGAFPIPFDGNDPINYWPPYIVAVTKANKDVDAAMAFVNYFGSKEGQQAFFTKLTGIPIMKGIEVKSSNAEKELISYAQTRKTVMTFQNLMKYASPPMEKYFQDLLVGAKTPVQVVEEMDKEYAKTAVAANDPNFK